MHRSLLLVLGLACFLALTRAQAPPRAAAPPESTPTIKTAAQEVILDMVFRNKKGKPIVDIKPEDVHVTEDGVAQTLKSFRLVEGVREKPSSPGGSSTEAAGARPTTFDPMKEIRLVTLVFEGLDVDGKRFFRAATKDLLEMAPEPNLYFSVYTVDQKLHCIQPFTTDHAAMNASVEKSGAWSFIQFQNQSSQIKESLGKIASGDPPVLSGSSAGGPSAAAVGALVNYQLAKIQYDALDNADRLDRDIGARASLFSLMNLVKEQAKLPGRKTVVYFNPWFNVPESLKELFETVKSVANRGNVSFYTVDPKGLTTWSQNSSGRDQIGRAAGESRQLSTSGGAGMVSTSQARAQEDAESGLRSNPMLFLKELAESTGGVAIAETNDWKAPLRMVLDEVRTYFEASYVPQNDALDGKFRRISVKVDRPDVIVHARNGYFAVPSLRGGQQLMPSEMLMLNALTLTATAPPSEVGFRASALRFNTHGQTVEYMLSIEVPIKNLTFQSVAEKNAATGAASLLTVVKDERGEIVAKFSKDFPLSLPLDKLDAYRAGNLTQTFRAELAPGPYQLETVVLDRAGSKTGVSRSKFVVPAPSTKLSVSQIAVVRRADVLKDTPISDAFYYEGGKIVPSLSDTLKGGPGNVLPFYFVVYKDPSISDAPKLRMSFYMDGQLLGAPESPLPPPQKDGRIPFIAQLPADNFFPGTYEMRVTIMQGPATAEEKLVFKVN